MDPSRLELKQVLGAMIFGARDPVPVSELRRVLAELAAAPDVAGRQFAKVSEQDIRAALADLRAELEAHQLGLGLAEGPDGFRFQTDAACGPWLRHLLALDKPARLSRPTLETLAIIAYRQPVMRSEIESVRGVTVDAIIRNLLEMQLIRVVGRSPLPGHPLLLGTTRLFLEHFGLKDLKELPGIEQLSRQEEARAQAAPATDNAGAATPAGDSPDTKPQPPGPPDSPAPTGGEQEANSRDDIAGGEDKAEDKTEDEDEDEDKDEDEDEDKDEDEEEDEDEDEDEDEPKD